MCAQVTDPMTINSFSMLRISGIVFPSLLCFQRNLKTSASPVLFWSPSPSFRIHCSCTLEELSSHLCFSEDRKSFSLECKARFIDDFQAELFRGPFLCCLPPSFKKIWLTLKIQLLFSCGALPSLWLLSLTLFLASQGFLFFPLISLLGPKSPLL